MSEVTPDKVVDGNDSIESSSITRSQTLVLLASVMVVALCGIVYELIIASVSSYLLGNSVYQFSITIGLFMFAMGLGSYISKWFHRDLTSSFILVEVAVAIIGGISSSLLFMLFPYPSLYKPVMYSLLIIIGTLVGLEIPLLTRILSNRGDWKEAIANVLSLDYLGALVGSVAFPLIMLPSLGLFRSSFAIGLLNAGVALGAIVFFGKDLKRYRTCLVFSISAVALLLAGLFFAERLSRYAENKMYGDQVVYTEQTPYQRIVVTQNVRNKGIRLYLDKHIQFASVDEYRYHESLIHPVMSLPGSRKNVLILGGGDGMAVREILKYPDVENIVLVDIDPAVNELCNSFEPIRKLNQGSLESEKLTIVNTDAFRFMIERADDLEKFDRVIIDLPDPHNEVLDKLYSKEFYEIIRFSMSPDGYLVSQCSSPFFAKEVYWCIAETLEAAGYDLRSYNLSMVSFGVWGFHLASANGKPIHKVEIEQARTRYLTTEAFEAMCVFGKDIARIESPVNRTFEPKLYTLYLKNLNR